MINTPDNQLKKRLTGMHPSLQFLSFLAVCILSIAIGYAIGVGVVWLLYGVDTVLAIGQSNLSKPNAITGLWILQIISTTIPLFAAPVFFAYVVVKEPADYLKAGVKFNGVLLLMVLAIMFISSPLIELLSNINEKMVLPPFLHWMRDMEDQAQKVTAILLKMNSIWQMLFNLLVVGLLTAIAEEFAFRGVIQTIFTRLTKNYHAAVWITAILFSAFHLEFFGFLPRLMLGVLFGYFVAWSGSIWTAVWAHFINNGTAVVVTYLFQHKKIKINPDDQHVFNSAGYVISLVIVLFLLYVYHIIASNKPKLQQE
jgi:membrane protease YdiL (CAAX protease family)